MSWAAVAASAISAGVGIYQTQQGKKLAEQAGERPDYEIPQSAIDALGTAQLRSMQGMPGAVKSQMLQEMDRSRMASLRQVSERRGGLGAVSQLEQKQQDAIRQMGIMDIQKREENIQALQKQRGLMAGYEEAKQADTLASWEQQSQAAAAMKGAGMQNIAGAVTGVATAAASGAFKGAGGTDSNIFTGKKREAFKLAGGKEGTGMSFGQYKRADVGGGGYTDFIQANPNFIQQRQEMRRTGGTTGGTTQPQYIIPEVPSKQFIDTSTLSKNMGFGGGLGYNEGITSNIGLSLAMNRNEANNPPSLQRQSFGANLGGTNMPANPQIGEWATINGVMQQFDGQQWV